MSAFILRYLDNQFASLHSVLDRLSTRLDRLETTMAGKIDDLKAEMAGLRDDLAAGAGRDDEDYAEAQRRIAELEAKIAADEGDVQAMIDEVRGLRTQVQAKDLDPAFPPPPPEGDDTVEGGPAGPDEPVEPEPAA